MRLNHIFLTGTATVMLVSPAHLQTQGQAASTLIAKSSEVYRAMQTGYTMRAELWRRVSLGEFWQEIRREYRFSQRDRELRLDHGPAAQALVFLRRSDGSFIIYSAGRRQYAEHTPSERPTAELRELQRMQNLFYQRLADLAGTKPVVTAEKQERIKAAGDFRACRKISIKGSTWTGAVWIEEATGLVWRSQLTVRRNGELTEERVTWLEIATQAEAVDAALAWSPPAGTTLVPRLVVLPPNL